MWDGDSIQISVYRHFAQIDQTPDVRGGCAHALGRAWAAQTGGGGRPESTAVTTATCGHSPFVSAHAGCCGTAVLPPTHRRACWVACCTAEP
eukprot:COSAG01_NODE_805_length_13443_cov_81.464928_11_plen_92_part_00